MAEWKYRSIGARLRPPRFVVGYRPGRDWIHSARQVIASISRTWGGTGAVIAPLGASGQMSDALISVMRSFDPDHVAVHGLILADLAHDDPEFANRILERYPEEDRDEVWRELRKNHVNLEALDALAEQANSYLSPFKSGLPGARKLSPGDIIWLHRYGESRRHITTLNGDPTSQTIVLDLSQVDPVIALMVESRIGSVDNDDREGRNILELPVFDDDLPEIIRLAITGTVRPQTWDLQSRYLAAAGDSDSANQQFTIETLLNRCPTARSGQSTIKAQTMYPEAPIVCVIGDTADDHALAIACDRLFQHGAWIPTHLLADDSPLRMSVALALYLLRNISRARDRPVLFTSQVNRKHL